MGIPQWIVMVMLGIQAFFSFFVDGRPRDNPNYNGPVMLAEAIALFALLAWGGFFKPMF